MAINLFGNLNLNNNAYNTGMSEGVSGTNSAQIVDNSRILSSLQSLLPGQTIDGQILNQDGKALQLLLGDNVLLNTTLDSQAQIPLGQNLSFEIKSNNNGQLVLRPLHTNMSNSETAVKALESASVKVSEETIRMVDSLMKEGMPINKDMLQTVNREINMYPQANVNDIVLLHKLGLPVNEENINQMNMYSNNNQWMMGNIHDMSNDIFDMLTQTENAQEYNQLIDKLESLFGNEKGEASVASMVNNKIVISEDNQDANNGNVFELLRKLSPDKLNSKEHSNLLRKSLTDMLSNKFLMDPEKVADKEYVKNYYEKVMDTSREMEKFLSQNQKGDSALAKDMSGIRSNIDFMNQLNELYNYVQLPLKMSGAQAQGDLYVYSKRHQKGERQADEPLTALLHLSMETLGNMDIFLKLDQGKLSTDFSLEKEEMIDFIESHIDELNGRLADKGYNVTTKVGKLTDTDRTLIDNIKNESPQISVVGNHSFDARA